MPGLSQLTLGAQEGLPTGASCPPIKPSLLTPGLLSVQGHSPVWVARAPIWLCRERQRFSDSRVDSQALNVDPDEALKSGQHLAWGEGDPVDYLLSPPHTHRGKAEESMSFPRAGQREGSLHPELQIQAFLPRAPGYLPLEGRDWQASFQSCSVSLGDFKSNQNKAKPHAGCRDNNREAARCSGKNMSFGERSRFGSPTFRILLHKMGRVVSIMQYYHKDWT